VTLIISIEALLFNAFGQNPPFSDCAHVTVGGIYCVEEVDHQHRQAAGQKCGFDSSRIKWTFGSGSLLCQGFKRRREETAWKQR